jgi:hypothetical protein
MEDGDQSLSNLCFIGFAVVLCEERVWITPHLDESVPPSRPFGDCISFARRFVKLMLPPESVPNLIAD